MLKELKQKLRIFPDFPTSGIQFVDIMPLFKDPQAIQTLCNAFVERLSRHHVPIHGIAALESRGFLIGPILASKLGVSFIPIRKKGKLPGPTLEIASTKEYGNDILEIQVDALEKGHHIVIVDDLLATGGTISAAIQLIQQAGGIVLESLFIVEIEELAHVRSTLEYHALFKV